MKQLTCCGEVIKNSAMGTEFWYCRGCKKEVGLTPVAAPNSGMTIAQFEDWVRFISEDGTFLRNPSTDEIVVVVETLSHTQLAHHFSSECVRGVLMEPTEYFDKHILNHQIRLIPHGKGHPGRGSIYESMQPTAQRAPSPALIILPPQAHAWTTPIQNPLAPQTPSNPPHISQRRGYSQNGPLSGALVPAGSQAIPQAAVGTTPSNPYSNKFFPWTLGGHLLSTLTLLAGNVAQTEFVYISRSLIANLSVGQRILIPSGITPLTFKVISISGPMYRMEVECDSNPNYAAAIPAGSDVYV